MAISIAVPIESSSVKQYIDLNNTTYKFIYTYNEVDERLRISIYRGEELLVAGIKIMENQSLLAKYKLDSFDGDLFCKSFKGGTSIPATLGTVGLGLEYELIYLTQGEIDNA